MNQVMKQPPTVTTARERIQAARPSDDELRELYRTHTIKDLPDVLGVGWRTIQKWGDQIGMQPCYHCLTCDRKLPRDQCLNPYRCFECDVDIRNRSPARKKECTACGETKSFPMFSLHWSESGWVKMDSQCKACRYARSGKDPEFSAEQIAAQKWVVFGLPALVAHLNGYKGQNGHAAWTQAYCDPEGSGRTEEWPGNELRAVG